MITKPVEQAGFIYIYLSNESNTTHDVYFDDLRITHTTSKILQEDHYYPFGLNIQALSSTAPLSKPNQFKYNGKEEQTGFDWYDYGARQYDPQIGRWLAPDPMADAHLEFSPYTYVANNPIKYIDPDGNIITDKDGNIVVTTTGEQVSVPAMQVSDVTRNADGTQNATFISRTYEVVNIFADNGTPIEALRLVAAEQIEATFDAEGNLIGSTSSAVNSEQYDCGADCHGYTFTYNSLWINDDQVEKLLENDGYLRNLDEEDASAVIFKKRR